MEILSGQEMPEWLAQRANISPDRLALTWGPDERWTYRDLSIRVEATARRLRTAGLQPGDRIGLLAWNSPAVVQTIHAVTRIGSVLVPLNARLTAVELRRQVLHASISALVYDEANEKIARSLLASPEAVHDVPLGPLTEIDTYLGTTAEPDRLHQSALHTIVFTSGTTGSPKGVMLSVGNHLWSAIGSCLNLGLSSDDRWLLCLPLFHVGGLAILFRSVICGTAIVLQESFDPVAANRAIDEEGVTVGSVVGTMLRRMLKERHERPYPPTMRCLLVGGGPVPSSLLSACQRLGLPAVHTYGLTESASQVATERPEETLRPRGSAGRPLFPTEIRIEGEDGTPLPAGKEGEIAVRGPTVSAGYYNQPEESKHLLRGGWLHTGDLGRLDREGYLHVVGRRDDTVVSGGENVNLKEVEEALNSHPQVADAGAVGLPHPVWDQVVGAGVVVTDGASVGTADLMEFCRSRLAPYKLPNTLQLLPELPRNALGKLSRTALREILLQKSPH